MGNWRKDMSQQQGHTLSSGTTLVLGGARSGKSTFAEKLILQSGLRPIYIATSNVWDAEMRLRVDQHVARRGDVWTSIEEPLFLENALKEADDQDAAILVDCLTLWITNLMMDEADLATRFSLLTGQLRNMKASVVLVSNEVGLGIVPDNKMARDFRDHAGKLHQDIAEMASQVHFVVSGMSMKLKG